MIHDMMFGNSEKTSDKNMSLTKTIAGTKVILTHVKDNTYKLTAEDGTFTKGKSGIYSTGEEINTAETKGNELIITKAEIKRLGTYMVYLNGKENQLDLSGKWVNNNGIEIVILDPETDIYYYFNRPDCGILNVHYAEGTGKETEISRTILYKKLDISQEIIPILQEK